MPQHLTRRIRRILTERAGAQSAQDMELPGDRLHPLKGDRGGQWSVRVSGNWRIVFRFVEGEAVDVDLIDYHWLTEAPNGESDTSRRKHPQLH